MRRSLERVAFVGALLALGVINALIRMPVRPLMDNSPEWFAFYFTPPIGEGLLFAAFCWIFQRARRGRSEASRLPLVGILVTVVVLSGLAMLGHHRAGRI